MSYQLCNTTQTMLDSLVPFLKTGSLNILFKKCETVKIMC